MSTEARMLDLLLKPVNRKALLNFSDLRPTQLGRCIDFHEEGKTLDLQGYDIAVLGVREDRMAVSNKGCGEAPGYIRKELYKLFRDELDIKVIDLGNIEPGESVKDTYFGLATVLNELLKEGVVPIILGGSHDLTYAQYLGYQEAYELANLVVIDEKIDINMLKDNIIDSESYLLPIFVHQPNFLFNYCHLGYQSYLTDIEAINYLEGLSFDCERLGPLRAKIEKVEPMIRDADMLSIDVAAIRQSDAPGHMNASPNGLRAEDMCQIARYAGYSDKLTSLGIYELNPDVDHQDITAKLVAQMVWHFIEGFYNRKGDFPDSNKDDFVKYIVEFEDLDYQIIFWKSNKSSRWWMELPYGDKEKFGRQQLVSCAYDDYLRSSQGELPDRWMKAYRKLA